MSVTYRRKPSLYDASARVARAGEHIKELEAEFSRSSAQFVNIGDADLRLGVTEVTFADPEQTKLSILIGETAYNLKAALDYLVFELFYLSTGQFDNRTKFIIEETPEGWQGYLPNFAATPVKEKEFWLHKLRAEHQTALKRLQPFSTGQWLLTLRDITNPDRHRALTGTIGRISYTQIDGAAGTIPDAIPMEMFVNLKVTRSLSFHDGLHVIETLHHLQREVGNVIQAFEPDFK